MRIFISYRRSDSGYLAHALRRELIELSPSNDVFVDNSAIELGVDFTAEIEDAVDRADVLVALIGPAWSPERLGDPGDLVRKELLSAHEQGTRIVPALHSGAVIPATTDLPAELEWLRWTNAFEFGSASALSADTERLFVQLTSRVPELADLQAKVWKHYERGEVELLIEAVDQAWQEYSERPSPALADCCRVGALARLRSWGEGGERDLWLVRALSTAYQSGASNAFAVTMLPFFFRLCSRGELSAARGVLAEIRRLTVDGPFEFPPATMMHRLYHEKLGHTFLLERDTGRARPEYERAADYSSEMGDQRGTLKIAGSLALCTYLDGDIDVAAERTETILDAARRLGTRDVVTAATKNLEMMRAGGDDLTFYEVT